MTTSVWRAPGMRPLLAMSALAFAGFGLLMPVSPLWAVHGGADERGAGLVTATLMLFTVLAQLRVNAVIRALGWGPVLGLGLFLLGAPAPVQALSSDLWLILATSAARGMGFGIITVCGATAIALLVAPEARGRGIGAYGLVLAAPQLVLTPAAPLLVERLGFPAVLVLGAAPLLGLAWVAGLGRRLTAAERDRTAPAGTAAAAGAGTDSSVEHADVGRVSARRRLADLALRIWRPLLALLLATSAGGALLTFTTQIAPDTTTAVLALISLTGAAAVCRWQLGGLTDRWGTRPFLRPLLVVGAGGLVLVGGATGAVLLIAGALVVGVAYGGLQSVTLVTAFADGRDGNHARVSVAWNVGFDLGTGLGAAVVGLIAAQFSFRTAFLVLAAACIVVATALTTRSRR